MDKDEEIYREMNEEDGFYMGDSPDEGSKEPHYNSGCASMIIILIIMSVSMIIL